MMMFPSAKLKIVAVPKHAASSYATAVLHTTLSSHPNAPLSSVPSPLPRFRGFSSFLCHVPSFRVSRVSWKALCNLFDFLPPSPRVALIAVCCTSSSVMLQPLTQPVQSDPTWLSVNRGTEARRQLFSNVVLNLHRKVGLRLSVDGA